MKVTFVMYGAWYAQGGMEKYNRRLIRALQELPEVTGQIFSVLDAPGTPCAFPMRTGGGKTGAVIEAAITHLLTGRPDHLILGHVDFLPVAAAARVLAPRCKVTLLANGPEVWGDASHRRTPGWEALLARRAPHRIAALSAVTLKRMSRRHNIPRDRFVLLPPAVDGVHERPKRPHGHTLLTVARLGVRDVNKGVGLVIRALPKILERFPAVRYRIVGGGPLIEPLWEFAIEMGVHRRVEFLGPVDDMALEKAYQQADIVVLPSKKEGSGLAFLEAWSHGLPVVGGADDAAAWLIEDGVTGMKAPPGHVAAAVGRLLADPKAAKRMGEAGRDKIAGTFDHESFRARLAGLLGTPDVPAPPPPPADLPDMEEAEWEPVTIGRPAPPTEPEAQPEPEPEPAASPHWPEEPAAPGGGQYWYGDTRPDDAEPPSSPHEDDPFEPYPPDPRGRPPS